MPSDYRKIAEEILGHTHGKENIVHVFFRSSRLVLTFRDRGQINTEALIGMEPVRGLIEADGQIQLVLGPEASGQVCGELLDLAGLPPALPSPAEDRPQVESPAPVKPPLWEKWFHTFRKR